MTNRLLDRLRKLESERPVTYERVRQRFVYPDGTMEGDLPPDPPRSLTIEICFIDAVDGRPTPESIARFGKEIEARS